MSPQQNLLNLQTDLEPAPVTPYNKLLNARFPHNKVQAVKEPAAIY
jgi:hypothetical protein